MPTAGEQKALLFLGAVALLGGAVRLFGSDAPEPPTEGERSGLIGQVAATDSAIGATAARKSARKARAPASGGAGKRSPGRSAKAAAPGASSYDPPPIRAPTLGPDERPALDVDRATIADLDALPGIGPALAARIVADRNAHGAFGSLEALDGVRGIGPTLIGRLAPYVTFSGPRRPTTADGSGGGAQASGRVVGLIGGRP